MKLFFGSPVPSPYLDRPTTENVVSAISDKAVAQKLGNITNSPEKLMSPSWGSLLRRIVSFPFYSESHTSGQPPKHYELKEVVSEGGQHREGEYFLMKHAADNEEDMLKPQATSLTSKWLLGTSTVLLATAGIYLLRHYLQSIHAEPPVALMWEALTPSTEGYAATLRSDDASQDWYINDYDDSYAGSADYYPADKVTQY